MVKQASSPGLQRPRPRDCVIAAPNSYTHDLLMSKYYSLKPMPGMPAVHHSHQEDALRGFLLD